MLNPSLLHPLPSFPANQPLPLQVYPVAAGAGLPKPYTCLRTFARIPIPSSSLSKDQAQPSSA
jgi:hypothetical protein